MPFLILFLILTALAVAALVRRRVDLLRTERTLAERRKARQRGSDRARLQYPEVDLRNCIGCGACVRACPEDGVLMLEYGQAVVAHGARCVGHGLCAQACPTSAIALTLGDINERRDLPAIDEHHQAIGVPGLFLAGEITGFALVRTAVGHGELVAHRVVEYLTSGGSPAQADGDDVPDLLVIGVGPAGLSCLLAAKEQGLRAVGIDQAEELGGTVAAYPRRKLVMTQPMRLPLHGHLERLEYTKEELVDLWRSVAAEQQLSIEFGVVVDGIERRADGTFSVRAGKREFRARSVCLAVGRRGTPRKLGVPGEDLPKVAYSLLDAESYRDRKLLVVGGGDSAIEAALALAEQPGNQVTLSYRRGFFSRLKAKNEQRIQAAIDDGLVLARMSTVVADISEREVALAPARAHGDGGGVATAVERLPNDHVFVFAGGTPPFPLLETAGVSFDPELRPVGDRELDRGTGLLVAMAATLLGLVMLLGVRVYFGDYYETAVGLRGASDLHAWLRPQGMVGLWAGSAAVLLFVSNLGYLVRRVTGIGRRLPGSLKAWMNLHIATGLGACVLAVLHSAFQVRDSAGGHALLAMVVVVVAGIVGRWFYAFVPRAQNGRQQSIDELGEKVAAIAGEWDRDGRGISGHARQLLDSLVERAGIGRSFFSRVKGLLKSQWLLRRHLADFAAQARADGVPDAQIARMTRLARRSHRLAMQLAHYDDLRGLMSTWRWLHRWLAVMLVVLTIVHIVSAYRYGGLDFSVLWGGAGQ